MLKISLESGIEELERRIEHTHQVLLSICSHIVTKII